MNARVIRLSWLAAALMTAGCAARDSRPDFTRLVTGPGGVPIVCNLPDCALLDAFSTTQAAALAGFDELRGHPDWTLREYGGCVFEDAPGSFRATHTARFPDDRTSRNHCPIPSPPSGKRKVASFHNHPTLERFSDWDVPSSIESFILAPSGTVYRYTPPWEFHRWENDRWVLSPEAAPRPRP